MATKIDTPKARATILEYLASGPAVTYRKQPTRRS